MTEKIEAFWENATANDVARVMAGETVEARFRDEGDEAWGYCALIGWVNEQCHQWRSAGAGGRWDICQVYREPSWYADRPDPGPGYRLLDKFPDEELKPGDEYFNHPSATWRVSTNAKDGQPQLKKTWYRRRIEVADQVNPVEPASDLASAARAYKANQEAIGAAGEVARASHAELLNAFASSQKVEAVVMLDGQHYLFWTNANQVQFRKIEVLE